MARRKLGSLDCAIHGGIDGQGGGDGPLVILLHGFGAPGDDLVALHRALPVPAGTRFVFPAAPLALPPQYGNGRAWWPIDLAAYEDAMARGELRELAREIPAGLPAARSAVLGLLDACFAELGARPERTVLGGFSQGAMLSCDVLLHDRHPLAGAVLWSGSILAASEWQPRMAARKTIPILQSHGTADPILPFFGAEALRDLLVAAGFTVDFIAFRGQHEIPVPVLQKTQAFLAAQLG
jgi:phospholipase/carboxylesterase